LALFMLMKAKKKGDRKPEYKMYINWIIVALLALFFIAGMLYQFIF